MRTQSIGRFAAVALVTSIAACSTTNAPSASLTIRGGVSSTAGAASAVGHHAMVRTSGNQTGPGIQSGDPAALAVGMYALYISASGDCSNATLVEDYGAQPAVKDFLQHPTLFTGSPTAGSYACIGVKMSDVLSFKPKTTFGYCDSTVTYASSIYNTRNTTIGDTTRYFRDINLNLITPLGTDSVPVAEPVLILFTRDTAAALARGFNTGQTISLGASLVVPGSQTFVWGGTGTVLSDSSATACGINPGRPTFQ